VPYILYNLYCTVAHELNCQKRKKLSSAAKDAPQAERIRKHLCIMYESFLSILELQV